MLKHAIWGGGGYNLSTFYDFVLGSTYFVHICLGYEDLMKTIRLSTGSYGISTWVKIEPLV